MAWYWRPLSEQLELGPLIRALNQRLSKLAGEIGLLGAGAGGAIDSFLEGATTPSVAGARWWRVANAAPTSITALAGGAPGQEVTLWATTANTTLVHSAALLLKGGVNLTMTADETRRFATLDGLTWRET